MKKIPEYFHHEWHLVALSRSLKKNSVIARKLAGVPIAIFRNAQGIAALYDRCPHRNYPLSLGQMVNGNLECPYHGWQFDGEGLCKSVPGCDLPQDAQKLSAQAVHVHEAHGGIFIKLGDDGPAEPEFPSLFGDPQYDHFWWEQGEWQGNTFDAIENVLDPFHTKFIHHGFIRHRSKSVPVELLVNTWERSIEMIIRQNRPDVGLMSRFLEFGGRNHSSTRYYPPTMVQAQWEGQQTLTLCVTAFFTPQDETSFRPFACFTTRKGIAPACLKEALIRLFLSPVVEQDRKALAHQHEVAQAFGAPRYTQGPGDILGSRVHKLYVGKTLEEKQDAPIIAEL
ncbi:MAG: aromatic ring-hydroxylating dioxygenase subunit alpha [Alphaproteobacteria bacterium]|nr:aromatic ring-hydroxylating dioxygenase subunit alpha [Alphaproteobacteria bacterium]